MLIFFIAMLPALSWAEQREFGLTIEEVSIDVAPGFSNKVFAFNGQVPGPLIHVKEGDDVDGSCHQQYDDAAYHSLARNQSNR